MHLRATKSLTVLVLTLLALGVVCPCTARLAGHFPRENDTDSVVHLPDIKMLHPAVAGNDSDHEGNGTGHGGQGVHLASWNFAYVSTPLLITIFILIAGLLKILFHWAEFLSSVVPESCLLIVIGTLMGVAMYYMGIASEFQLNPRTFLLFLLPPIVLDSAYSLHDRVFAENIGTILTYAVIGTIINFMLLGPTLWGFAKIGAMGSLDIGLVECFLFSSFIVAVDPVAVLAIFQEIGVNNVLYFLVFGESLLNDAVTVVLSNTMKAFNDLDEIPPSQIAIGIGSFFTVSLGGLAIGIIIGLLTALITRTTSHVRVVEPLAVLAMAYLSYILAELFHWSGIISMIGCGLVQAQYAFHNLSRKSYVTVKYFIKMLSSTNDAVIFLFLGVELINNTHVWHLGFIMWTLFFILFYRAFSTFGLTFLLNRVDRVHPISLEEQFVMFYGGLRGAVCFALGATIRNDFRHKEMFLTTTFIVIMFTVFIQGITIKPLVSLCKIRRKTEEVDTLFEEVNKRVTDHLMSGIEIITSQHGANYMRTTVFEWNDKYFRRWFQSDPRTHNQRILEVYHKIALKDYETNVEKTPELFRKPMPGAHVGEADSNTLDDIPVQQEIETSILRRRQLYDQNRNSPQRQSILDRVLNRGSSGEVNSVEDMRRLLAGTPGHRSFHQKYDRNLTREDQTDLLTQLTERHTRASRLRAMHMRSQDVATDRRRRFQSEAIPEHVTNGISEAANANGRSQEPRRDEGRKARASLPLTRQDASASVYKDEVEVLLPLHPKTHDESAV